MLGWRKDRKHEASEAADAGPAPAAPSASPGAAPDGGAPPASPQHKRLGELLVDEGVISQGQLDEGLRKKEAGGGFIGQALVELGYLQQHTLINFLVKQYKLPHISLLDYEVGGDLLALVPKELCQEHRLLPIDKLGRILTVAMVDPMDGEALAAVREACPDLRIKPILCDWQHFNTVAGRLFGQDGDGGEPAEMTASSLGLSMSSAPESEAAEAAEEETADDEDAVVNAAVEALLQGTDDEESGPAAEKPKVDHDAELAALMDEQEKRKAQERTAPPRVIVDAGENGSEGGAPAASEFSAAIRQELQDALRETAGVLGDEVKRAMAVQGGAPAGMAPEDLAALLRDAVRDAVGQLGGATQETAAMIQELRAVLAQAPQGQSGPSAGEMAEAIRAGLQETLQTVAADTAAAAAKQAVASLPAQEGGPAGMTPEELAALLRDAVRDAVGQLGGATQETAAMIQELRAVLAQAPQGQSGPSAGEMAKVIRDGLADAIQPVMAETAASAAKQAVASVAAQEGGAPPADIAAALKESLHGAFEASMGKLAGQLQEALSTANSGDPSEYAEAMQQSLAAILHDEFAGLVKELRAGSASHAANGDAIAKSLEESLRTTLGSELKPLSEAFLEGRKEAQSQFSMLEKALSSQAKEAAGLSKALQEGMAALQEAAARQHTSAAGGGASKDDLHRLAEAVQSATASALKSQAQDTAATLEAVRESVAVLQEAVAQQTQQAARRQTDDDQSGRLAEAVQSATAKALAAQSKETAEALSAVRDAVTAIQARAAESPAPSREQDTRQLAELATMVQSATAEALERQSQDMSGVVEALRDALAPLQQRSEGGDQPPPAYMDRLTAAVEQAGAAANAAAEAARGMQALQERKPTAGITPKMPTASEFTAKKKDPIDGDKDEEGLETDTIQPFPKKKPAEPVAASGINAREALDALHGPGERTRTDARVREALEAEQPMAGFTFDTYFVSKANQFAVVMSKAIAEAPGEEYNPFFLYGDVGVGKTHMINAIANDILQQNPDFRVGYVATGRFVQRLQQAIQRNDLDAFREAYCHWDVLVLDDVQFLAGQEAAQEELFQIFNALQQVNRQIILAGDQAPDKMAKVEKRLVSRFAGGIVTALETPDYATRIAILNALVEGAGVDAPHEILSVIASRVPNDIRKMTGALRKVIAYAGLVGQDISCELAYEILNHLGITEAA